MQTLDLPCNPSVESPASDPSAMSDNSSPIHSQNDSSSKEDKASVQNNSSSAGKNNDTSNSVVVRRERPSRACTQRAAARLQAAAEAEAAMAEVERKRKRAKKEKIRVVKEESEEEEASFGVEDDDDGVEEEEENGDEGGGSPSLSSRSQCSKIVTPLVEELEPAQLPRWNIRSMWQLASIFNFLNVFRHLLNIKVEFSAEEFETALITPNNTLGDVHIPLLKAIPPVTRMALGQNTWVTVLCRKLRDWWHWVAEGDLPIVASHGAEIEAYNTLEPEVRVVILKALCDIRVEQEDIRSYIDDSIKRGIHLSVFRKERIGGDSTGISYWYEDDPVIGYRLYREIRKVEVKKGKGKNVAPISHSSYEWEAVATNFDEFVNVSEKLFSSKNRTEVAVGKKLQNDMLPEIEKEHKRKEKLLKKQHRQALMLDNMINMDGLVGGRSLRDRKPVTYTFDDYDRSINEAINVTKKKQLSPEPHEKREHVVKIEGSSNGGGSSTWDGDDGPSQYPRHDSFTAVSANSLDEDDDYDDNNDDNNGDDDDGYYDDQTAETLDRSNRRRQKPHRYSVNDFVEPHSDNDPDFQSDDEIVGEVIYDDEYLKKRKNKKRKTSSSSESEEEYRWNDENPEEEEDEDEEEEDDDNDSSNSDDEDSDNPKPRKFKSMPGRTRRGTKLRSVDDLQAGLRRSKRATRNQINYSQYEMSESENELTKHEKSDALDEQHFDESDNELSMGSRDFEENNIDKEDKMMMMPENNGPPEEKTENFDEVKQMNLPQEEEPNSRDQEEGGDGDGDGDGVGKRRFLDLNELAPGSGFDDGPASTRDEDDF